MLSFIARRLGLLIPTFFGITLLTFALIRMIPGDPVEVMMGERRLDPEMHAQAMERLGLNKPLYAQYFDYIGKLAHGDLGESLRTRESVWHEFTTLFPATLELALAALFLAATLGILAGVIAALKRGSLFDHGVMGISLAGYSMPIFWWGLILIMFFSVTLGWTPVSGQNDLLYDVERTTGFMLIDTWLSDEPGALLDYLHHLILPAIVLGTIPLAVIARMTRSSMLEVLREDYVRTARAKGLSPARVVFVHGLRGTDRDHLFLAGHWQVADRSHWRARLPRGAERYPADRLPGDTGQFHGGYPLRARQPTYPPPALRACP
jgi:dipeptide transport system permease protein